MRTILKLQLEVRIRAWLSSVAIADRTFMEPTSEPTVSFRPSPYLITVEGPPPTLALFLDMLYRRNDLDRNSWGVSHKRSNRAEFISELRASKEPSTRLGLSVQTKATAEQIERLLATLKLKGPRDAVGH